MNMTATLGICKACGKHGPIAWDHCNKCLADHDAMCDLQAGMDHKQEARDRDATRYEAEKTRIKR